MASKSRKKALTQSHQVCGLAVLNTLDERIASQALKEMKRDAIVEMNGRLVVRKKFRDRQVGRDEWDVDGQRMTLAEALAEILPGEGQSILKGRGP